MLFINLSASQNAAYKYACTKLQNTLDRMCAARKTLEEMATKSFDKSLAKCVYLITTESLQFEHEIHAQIDSLNCLQLNKNKQANKAKTDDSASINTVESLCDYLEETYIKSYMQLLEDKRLNNSLKNLINNHLQVLLSSLTQMRLFKDVRTQLN